MITLDEHNAEALATFKASHVPALNGIACNACGEELKDEMPGYLVMLDPPQERVKCSNCGFAGFRVVSA